MSIFDRLDRVASRAVDRINRIRVDIMPRVSSPNGRGGADPSREVIEAKGIFDYISIEHGIELGVRKSYREANDLRALQLGRDPQVSIDRVYFSGLADEPRQGDRVVFPDNPELPSFDVVSAQRDGLSRMVLKLTHRGAQV